MEEDKKKTCFVVGPIGTAGSETRNQADTLLIYIIRPALEPLGYSVKRADDEKSPGNITDHVINSVLDADLVVADLTGPNANAFYELGIRHREEKPTIHVLMSGQKPPFDVGNFNTIFYKLDNPADHAAAAEQVRLHAEATEREGFKVSNPITAARGHQQLAQSADPISQTVNSLANDVATLKQKVNSLSNKYPRQLRSDDVIQWHSASPAMFHLDTIDDITNRFLRQELGDNPSDEEVDSFLNRSEFPEWLSVGDVMAYLDRLKHGKL